MVGSNWLTLSSQKLSYTVWSGGGDSLKSFGLAKQQTTKRKVFWTSRFAIVFVVWRPTLLTARKDNQVGHSSDGPSFVRVQMMKIAGWKFSNAAVDGPLMRRANEVNVKKGGGGQWKPWTTFDQINKKKSKTWKVKWSLHSEVRMRKAVVYDDCRARQQQQPRVWQDRTDGWMKVALVDVRPTGKPSSTQHTQHVKYKHIYLGQERERERERCCVYNSCSARKRQLLLPKGGGGGGGKGVRRDRRRSRRRIPYALTMATMMTRACPFGLSCDACGTDRFHRQSRQRLLIALESCDHLLLAHL